MQAQQEEEVGRWGGLLFRRIAALKVWGPGHRGTSPSWLHVEGAVEASGEGEGSGVQQRLASTREQFCRNHCLEVRAAGIADKALGSRKVMKKNPR